MYSPLAGEMKGFRKTLPRQTGVYFIIFFKGMSTYCHSPGLTPLSVPLDSGDQVTFFCNTFKTTELSRPFSLFLHARPQVLASADATRKLSLPRVEILETLSSFNWGLEGWKGSTPGRDWQSARETLSAWIPRGGRGRGLIRSFGAIYLLLGSHRVRLRHRVWV